MVTPFCLAVFLLALATQFSQRVAASPRSNTINSAAAVTAAAAAVGIEHPVFFNMEGLLDDPVSETMILQGLNDLVYSNYSDLYFLYSGRVLQSKGVYFTHVLISRFPSVETLRVYYDYAITDIARAMGPWLKKEYCVDYEVEMNEDAMTLNVTKDLAAYVIFIKASSNLSDSDIEGAMDAFLGLGDLGYTLQLTCGENLYMRESYRTMSHGFSAYFASEDAMAKWEEDPAVLSVLEGTILPMAESYAMVSVLPFGSSMDAEE